MTAPKKTAKKRKAEREERRRLLLKRDPGLRQFLRCRRGKAAFEERLAEYILKREDIWFTKGGNASRHGNRVRHRSVADAYYEEILINTPQGMIIRELRTLNERLAEFQKPLEKLSDQGF